MSQSAHLQETPETQGSAEKAAMPKLHIPDSLNPKPHEHGFQAVCPDKVRASVLNPKPAIYCILL